MTIFYKIRKYKRRRRELRLNQTDAERKLWACLKSRRLLGFKFHRQFTVGHYILDFYCPKERIAIELDGGQHNDGVTKLYDMARTEFLSLVRIRILRFWNNEVFENINGVIQKIISELTAPGPTPPNLPFSKGEGPDTGCGNRSEPPLC